MAEEQLPLDFGDGSNPRAQIAQWAEDNDVEVIFFDPPEHFDHAILGLVHGFGQEPAVVYDQALVMAAMSRDMASDCEEWFEFNTIGAFVGEATPRFLIRPWEGDYAVAPTDRTEEDPNVEET